MSKKPIIKDNVSKNSLDKISPGHFEKIPLPLPVEVVKNTPTHTTTASISPDTTLEEDRHTKAARFNDSVWEYTQALIALSTVIAVLYANVLLSISSKPTSEISTSALMQLNVLGGIIVGFYFGRTNHARLGGVSEKSRKL